MGSGPACVALSRAAVEQALKEAVAKAVGATASDSKLSTLVESARRRRLADRSGPQSQSPDFGIPMTVMSLSVSRQHLIVQGYIDTIAASATRAKGAQMWLSE